MNFVSAGSRGVTTANQCAIWTVQNGGTLNVAASGTIGNAYMDTGNLVVTGTVTGFAEAGGFALPEDATEATRQGGQGAITVNAGGRLATALIGPDSSLTATGASSNRAQIGALQTEGTVTLNNALIDPALATYLEQASLAMQGGTVTINDSEIRGDDGVLSGLLMVAPRAQANTTSRMTVTNSQVTHVNDVPAITVSELGLGYLDFDLTLTNTTATSLGNAIFLRQRSPTPGYAGHGAITLTVSGGIYSGSNAINLEGMGTQPVLITLSNGVQLLAPTAGPFDAGTAVLLAGASTVNATDSVIQGADHGLKLISGPRALGGATVTLVNTQVTGAGGSAIAISRATGDAVTRSAIIVGAGTTLSGGDGNILAIDNGALADFTADGNAGGVTGAVTLSGNIAVDGVGTALNAALHTNAAITGNIDASAGSTVTLTADTASSQFNGAVNADAATVNVDLRNGARLTGGLALSNQSTGQVSLAGSGTVLSNGNGVAINVDNSNVTINLANGATLAGANNVLVDVANAGQADVTLDDTVQTGDMTRSDDGALNVTLQNGARYTGNVTADNMTVNSGATWLLANPYASTVDTLSMTGGIVDFNAGTGPYKTLTVNSLTGGGGTFNMGVDFNPGASNDLLAVKGQVNNANLLAIANGDQGIHDPRNNITVVQTGGGAGQFGLTATGKVDAGIYVYSLKPVGNDWLLVREGTTAPPNPTDPTDPTNPTNPTNPTDPGNPDNGGPTHTPEPKDLSPAAKTALSLSSSLPYVFYGEMGTLRQRQGDLRLNKADSGVWARSYYNRTQIAQSAAPGYDLDQYGGAIGADKRMVLQSGDLYVGGFGSYSYNTLGIQGGSTGRVNSYGLGGYATWVRTDGWYVDSVIKTNNFENEARVIGSNGQPARGKYSTPGVGASVELGKHIGIGDQGFIEPYAQLAGFHARSASKDLDSGFQIRSGPTKSVQAQVGMLAGTHIEVGKGYVMQPYIKGAFIREFINNNSVTLNGTRIIDDLSGNRMLVGAGVATQVKQNLQVHLDVDYTTGGPVNNSVNLNLGVRYAF